MSRGRKVRPADMRRALEKIARWECVDREFAAEDMRALAQKTLGIGNVLTLTARNPLPADQGHFVAEQVILTGAIIQYERAERDTWTIACDCAWCRENDARADSGAWALAWIGEALTAALRGGFCTTCETWACMIPVWDPVAYWRRPYLRDFDAVVTTNVVEPRHRIPIDALTSEWDDRPSHGMFCSCHECDW